jgi:hypothetical protein
MRRAKFVPRLGLAPEEFLVSDAPETLRFRGRRPAGYGAKSLSAAQDFAQQKAPLRGCVRPGNDFVHDDFSVLWLN